MREVEDRKLDEAQFHDQRERDRNDMSEEAFLAKYPNKRFYHRAVAHTAYLDEFINRFAGGSDVLDYCCGLGGSSLKFAKAGAKVTGIDISEASVATAAELLRSNGYVESSQFQVGDAEQLEFEDDSFDIVICNGVLHHLDVDRAFPEISRVLRPGGQAICLEALGYNPFIMLYRKLTPKLRTEWEADHILTNAELKKARRYFGEVDVRYFYLASIPGLVLRGRAADALLALGTRLDKLLLKLPGIQLSAWQMVFILRKPTVG